MRSGLLMTPRPLPGRLLPAAGAAVGLVLALPVFLVAGWPIGGWAIGAVLWLGTRALSLVLARLREGAREATASGLHAFELFFKGIVVLAVLVALAASNKELAIAAVAVYALAYTLELGLSLAAYFGGPTR